MFTLSALIRQTFKVLTDETPTRNGTHDETPKCVFVHAFNDTPLPT